MRRHTPGPWRIGKGAIDYGAVVSDISPNPRRLDAEKADEKAAYGGYIIAESITRNNKPLIAMAPEILEACEDAHQLLSVCLDLKSKNLVEHVMIDAMNRLADVIEGLDELEREVTE